MALLGNILRSVAEAFATPVCEVCGSPLTDGEETLCMQCRFNLPRTKMHLDPFNEIHRRLARPGLPIDRAGAYFYYFSGNPYAYMLQHAKYNGRPLLARRLGSMYAREILADHFFDGIDVLLPVPLHFTKLISRGYNQSEQICCGISQVTEIPIADNLRVARHTSQTRKSAQGRMANTCGIFSLKYPEDFDGQHILLVDDIITTGSTLLGALDCIHSAAPTATLSVLTLGCTKLR